MSRRLVIGLSVIAILLFAAGGALTYWLSSTTPVPELRGKTLEQAEQHLSKAGLRLGKASYDKNAAGARGAVVTQRPPAGTRLSPSSIVFIVIAGPEIIIVPDVTGQTETDARHRLEKSGFRLGSVGRAFDHQVAKGIVINQQPPPGKDWEKGATVDVVVSTGQDIRTVPSVVGKTRSAGKKALARAGFKTKVKERRSSVAKGKVISQSQKPNSRLEAGATIVLVVSKGPQLVEVPQLIGLSVEEASLMLRQVGLVPREISVHGPQNSDALMFGPGSIYNQSPRPGVRLPKGSRVRITYWWESQ